MTIEARIAELEQLRLSFAAKQRELDSVISSLNWAKSILGNITTVQELVSLVNLLLPETLRRLIEIDPNIDLDQVQEAVLVELRKVRQQLQQAKQFETLPTEVENK